jgi:Mlc titration factor MtfA (ptsG expression regulator)
MRTVRLDEEAEKVLAQIVTVTGLSVSAAMKKGLQVLRNDVVAEARRVPYDIYKELDLGPGGYAVAPATQSHRGVRAAIRRKLRR